MITAISQIQNTTTNKFTNAKPTTQIAFKGNFTKLGQDLFEEGSSKFNSKFGRVIQEATDTISVAFRKLLGNNELPFSEKPLTANGKIKHILPDGMSTIDIDVPDAKIKNSGIDGANIYLLDKDIPKNERLAQEAEELIQKEVNSLPLETEREIDPSKIIFGPDGMPIIDVDGKPMCEISDDVAAKIDLDEPHTSDVDLESNSSEGFFAGIKHRIERFFGIDEHNTPDVDSDDVHHLTIDDDHTQGIH